MLSRVESSCQTHRQEIKVHLENSQCVAQEHWGRGSWEWMGHRQTWMSQILLSSDPSVAARCQGAFGNLSSPYVNYKYVTF